MKSRTVIWIVVALVVLYLYLNFSFLGGQTPWQKLMAKLKPASPPLASGGGVVSPI